MSKGSVLTTMGRNVVRQSGPILCLLSGDPVLLSSTEDVQVAGLFWCTAHAKQWEFPIIS